FSRRRLHGDVSPLGGFVGVTLSFGLMTLLGFANYLLGVAILVVVVTLWLELMLEADARRGATGRREAVIAGAACVLFVSHGHAYVIFLGLAVVMSLATGDRRGRLLRLRALAPSFALAAWSALASRGTPEGSAPITWTHSG